jgi:lipopolysaccharide biosynthesis glycosyltransferase
MQTFCTIINASYLPFAKVLYRSLQQQVPGTSLQVLVTDKKNIISHGEFIIHEAQEIAGQPLFREIERKYAHTNSSHFRWALKPVFISYLLQKGFSKVIFADPDLYFVNDFRFLFTELDRDNILLTPHWANIDPMTNEDSLFSVLRGGLFNAGFIAANKDGKEAIDWWAGMCHYKMENRKDLGLYDDQKYLDILPVQFPGVQIVKHQGCNLASWNIDTCKREMINGQLMINKLYKPVFIHFAKDTITNILNKNDALLRPYLDEYITLLQEEGFALLKNLDRLDPATFDSSMYSLKHKLRLRTRFKRFLFRLAEKL